jgi:peptidoglycan/xylan/chitin deacetylase (PgdA/CDA1 family)
MNHFEFAARLLRACERRLARYLGRRRFAMLPGTPMASFTFDDFPRSALANGGAILEAVGTSGTYYASLGLSGRTTETGEQFTTSDLETLLEAGHELGCHTFDHCHAWDTSPADFEASVVRNAQALQTLVPGTRFRTHSYPLSIPRPATKRRVARHVTAARCGGQRFNCGRADLNYLNAFFIEQSRDHFETIKRLIDANARAGGWLIFATHDVAPYPTRYGCTPALLERIVHDCIASGTAVVPVTAALSALQSRAADRRVKAVPFTSPAAVR